MRRLRRFFLRAGIRALKYLSRVFLCPCGLHRWVWVSKGYVGLCWGCDGFYEVGKRGKAGERVMKNDRPNRRRIMRGVTV